MSDKDPFGYIFYANGELVMKSRFKTLDYATRVLSEKATVLLFDGNGGLGEDLAKSSVVQIATTVLLTSPKKDRWRYIVDLHGPEVLYTFPVFSLDEITDMLESCFEHLRTPANRQLVADRYALWGGIPRYVLAQALSPDAEQLVKTAVNTMDIDAIANALEDASSVDDSSVPHRLFHLVPAGKPADGEFEGGTDPANYRWGRLELGSRRIASRVFAAVRRSQQQQVAKWLATPTMHPSLSKF